MEPKLSPQGPSVEVGRESLQKASAAAERDNFAGSQESKQATVETRESGPQGPATGGPTTSLPAPVIAQDQAAAQGTPSAVVADTDNPVVAGDDDLIEKEWVQKAKKIVEQTRADPHSQEQEVSKLQADYLKKRYGKEIKTVNN